jgi:archaellum component FlaF (FlaF/FlaG flagellin family)
MSVKIARTASPSNWMHGDVTSYNIGTGALVVNSTNILGSGTYTDWTVTLSAPSSVSYATAAEIIAGTEASKAIAPDQLKAAGVGKWMQTSGTFTATPASTSTLTMTTDLTATLLVGTPLKYVYDTGGGATTYYGIVSAIASNLLTIAGAPFDTGHDITALYYGDATRVSQINVIIPGLYEDASNTDLISSDLNSKLIWNKSKAYLVRFRHYSVVHDSGATHGQASVQINNTEVNTTAGGELIAANATWYPTVVNIATAAYDVNPGEEIEVTSIKGTTGDASDLTVEMTFVIP